MDETSELLTPLGIDSFKGSIECFRLYLKAQRALLVAGIIV
jgi:hypothetical protein